MTPKVQPERTQPVVLITPPPNPLKEILPEAVIRGWKRSQNPSEHLLLRWQTLEADGTYPVGMRSLRAQKAAWERYLEAGFACRMFEGDKGSDLRGRLTGIDDDNFRSAMAECLVCWFFAGRMRLPINPSAPGREGKNLEMTVFDDDRDIGVEVKAPYRPHRDVGWGDDSDAIEGVLEQAEKQFDKGQPNILVVVPSGRLQFCASRKPLMRALYGRSKITFLVSKKTGAAVTEPKSEFFAEGKFFNNKRPGGKLFKPRDSMPAYQRVSALMCIEERVVESDPEAALLSPRGDDERREADRRIAQNRIWIEHEVVVLHNPFAYHPIRTDLFQEFPQCVPAESKMIWSDGHSTVV